jgi:plastocyanin
LRQVREWFPYVFTLQYGGTQGDHTVIIDNSTFSIKELKIKKGTKVTWINNDDHIHTVTELNGKFDSGNMIGGKSFSYTFQEEGTFIYYCATHPSMEAKVIVE